MTTTNVVMAYEGSEGPGGFGEVAWRSLSQEDSSMLQASCVHHVVDTQSIPPILQCSFAVMHEHESVENRLDETLLPYNSDVAILAQKLGVQVVDKDLL